MKSDGNFKRKCEIGHEHVREFAEYLRGFGLRVKVLSEGFRATRAEIVNYEHDIDLEVEGYLCQYKHREVMLRELMRKRWWPMVDEKLKAHRTPVDFYILRFGDVTIVVPHESDAWRGNTPWKSELRRDEDDNSLKMYYVVHPRDCFLLPPWISLLLDD